MRGFGPSLFGARLAGLVRKVKLDLSRCGPGSVGSVRRGVRAGAGEVQSRVEIRMKRGVHADPRLLQQSTLSTVRILAFDAVKLVVIPIAVVERVDPLQARLRDRVATFKTRKFRD